jgi:hypothetical protein
VCVFFAEKEVRNPTTGQNKSGAKSLNVHVVQNLLIGLFSRGAGTKVPANAQFQSQVWK